MDAVCDNKWFQLSESVSASFHTCNNSHLTTGEKKSKTSVFTPEKNSTIFGIRKKNKRGSLAVFIFYLKVVGDGYVRLHDMSKQCSVWKNMRMCHWPDKAKYHESIPECDGP